MYTDPFITSLWICALARVPVAGLLVALDTIPSRYGPRVRA